jgi:branched-chain amino acid transport system substrate-binding protein
MNKKLFVFGMLLVVSFMWIIPVTGAFAADEIVIGVPTSLGFLEGKESHKVVQMAVSEINAKGGVNVGGTKYMMKVAAADLRDAAPGVPVSEALLGLEKIILEQKPTAIVVGPFRSEALIAGMDLISKYKVPLLGTVAMSPRTEGMVKKEPDKYKYIFRTSFNGIWFVKYLAGFMGQLNKEFGFNKVYVMHQDVAWARGSAGALKKMYFDKTGWDIVGMEAYPTGASDFSSGLMKARAKGAQIILPIFDMPQSGILVKQWKAMRVPALMAGFISPLAGSNAWKTFDGKIAGAMNAIFELGNIPSAKYAPARNYYNKFKNIYGKEIQSGHGPAPSYESVYILKEAIERAGSLDPDAIVAELKKTDRKGIMGRIQYDQGNQAVFGFDPNETAVGAFFQWTEDGRRKIVFPASLAEGSIKLPAGLKSLK